MLADMDPMLTAVWELGKSAGVFAVPLMVWLYLRADNERRDLAKQLLAFTESQQKSNDSWLKVITSIRQYQPERERDRDRDRS